MTATNRFSLNCLKLAVMCNLIACNANQDPGSASTFIRIRIQEVSKNAGSMSYRVNLEVGNSLAEPVLF